MQLTGMQLARLAITNYRHHDTASRKIVNHNRRQWIRSVRELGNKWKLHPDNSRGRLEVPLSIPIQYSYYQRNT